MSVAHFSLIFFIFHIVYGVITFVCDLLFFHCVVRGTLLQRYLLTILPVHRLFFAVISCLDGLLFTASGNILALVGDWVAPALIATFAALALIGASSDNIKIRSLQTSYTHVGCDIVIFADVSTDTVALLLSYRWGRPGLLCWPRLRAAVLLAAVLAVALWAAARQHPAYTWDLAPVLAAAAVSALMLAGAAWCSSSHNLAATLLATSATNLLGLCSVHAVSHAIMVQQYAPALDLL